jgi:hypothetical protein
MTIYVANWWCEKCGRWLASDDILAGVHLECKTKAVWRTRLINSFEDRDDGESADRPAPTGE